MTRNHLLNLLRTPLHARACPSLHGPCPTDPIVAFFEPVDPSSGHATFSVAGSEEPGSQPIDAPAGRISLERASTDFAIMPLINGQKMACEPCIRGHRSTKCTHANERLMVPVRKPGRPLSSCPHPSSRPCSCATVTAAIPRKQKCRCGTSEPPPADIKNDKDASAGDATPPSPSKAANSSFRVQKQGSKGGPSRKQSIDPVGLERMDANQLNILPAYNGMQRATPISNGQAASMPDMSMYGAMALTPAETTFGPESAMFPMFAYPMQSPMMTPAPAKPATNGHGAPSTNGSTTSSAAPTPGGCCGGGDNGAKARAATQQMPAAAVSTVDGVGESNAERCCSTASDSHKAMPRTESMPAPGIVQQPNGVMISPFQPPMAMSNGMYPYFPHPTIFNYPPQLGSFLQPLQPEQWRQFMSAMNFGQPVAAPPGVYGMAGPRSFHPPSTPNGTRWTSHQCTCGDSCQCVGCAAHPYNEATQNYVRSAWSTMAEDGPKPQVQVHNSNGHAKHVNGSVNSSHEPSASRMSSSVTTPVTTQAERTVSPPAPQTPSDAASGISEEQTLSANDFFFVSYPFGDACAGDMASCPCGDDCPCIGCVIHNNPSPEEIREDLSL
ncbi:Protein GRISEA [Tolypocladium capitatum]|uniref:Protein GRISEA n=1 Tax=Tolypocladium capitatum TaxID=45235 RepID=A0A2K3QPY3_9HYPO|nr:Protein GRISEA [Tolypocladium capitatum]